MTRAPQDLRAFVEILRREGELVEVEAEVSADLEVAEVHRRVIAAGGPALLFRHVRGCAFPLVDRKCTLLYSSHREIPYAVFCLKKKMIVV